MNTIRGFSLATIKPFVNASFLCVLATLLSNVAYGDCTPAGTIETVQGKVEIHHADSNSWTRGELNAKLCIQDRLKSLEQSRASIRLVNQTLVQLDANTTLTLTAAPSDQKKSVLELLEGLIHTLSRVPRSLEIRTPYVNASIEGTEFVVATSEQQSLVSVIEGKVRTSNANGSVLLGANESATSIQGQAPVRILQINPLEDVAWEISYLPVLEPGENQLTVKGKKAWAHYKNNRPDLALAALETDSRSDNEFDLLIAAASYLSLGKVESADKILSRLPPENVPALSLKSIIAIAKNQLDIAKGLIEKTSTLHSDAPEALLAKSYLEQATKNTSDALVTAKDAHTKYPESTLIASRLSELSLMNGYPQEAEKLAETITHKHPEDDRALTALGFSQLNNGAAEKSQQSFNKAILLNSVNSLNHLGLGLSKIKQGNLTEGRSHLETAVLLAPRHSLLRSYLGKAYFEEIRNPLVYDQLVLAKQYDPADPTPWLYEALTLHDDNRAIEALQSMEKSIELNDNRAVYRSQFLLDDDRASRSTALSTIYQALGFEQEAISPAALSLALSPDNSSAHRLLADAYQGQYHLGIARTNELIQAQLHAPVGQKLIPAQTLTATNRLLQDSGPLSGGYNEHNSLFLKNGPYADTLFTSGSQGTLEGELATGWIENKASMQASLYHMETEGNDKAINNYGTDVASFGLQWQIAPVLQIQINHNESETDKGQISQRFLQETIVPNYTREDDYQSDSVSAIFNASGQSTWTARVVRTESEFFEESNPIPNVHHTNLDNTVTDHLLIQNSYKWGHNNLITGIERTSYETESDFKSSTGLALTSETQRAQNKLYGYWHSAIPEWALQLTMGLDYTHQNTNIGVLDQSETLPKLGAQWRLSPQTQLALAWFKTLNDVYNHHESHTLAPTQIAGLNQLTSGIEREEGESTGFALEHTINRKLTTGLRYIYREGQSLQGFSLSPDQPSIQHTIKNRRNNAVVWFYWTLSNRWSLSLEHQYEDLKDGWEDTLGFSTDGLEKLKTQRTPITLSYHHNSGLSAHLVNTFVQQKGTFWVGGTPAEPLQIFEDSDEFWLTDASLSYRLPKRRGSITLGVKNLLDTDYQYEDFSSFDLLLPDETWVPSNYVRERFLFASVSLYFN